MAKKLRGEQMDERLKVVIHEMMGIGFKLAPISRSTVQRRLGLKSRSTLLLNGRAELIDQARKAQLHDAGLTIAKKERRRTHEEQIVKLKEQIAEITKDRDALTNTLAEIVNGLQAKGLNLEQILLPLRPNFKQRAKSKK